MDNYIVRKLLNDESLSEIQEILKNISEDEWVDGSKTVVGFNESIKRNVELFSLSEKRQCINSIIMDNFDMDYLFGWFCCPSQSGSCIISNTYPGGYYRPHTDYGANGHFSTTLFLNSPGEYDGGELSLFINGNEFDFKLDAGMAITYNTGIMHQVKQVTRGNRIVAVTWTKSHIKDSFNRDIYYNLCKLKSILSSDFVADNFYDASQSPQFILEELKNKILRRYY